MALGDLSRAHKPRGARRDWECSTVDPENAKRFIGFINVDDKVVDACSWVDTAADEVRILVADCQSGKRYTLRFSANGGRYTLTIGTTPSPAKIGGAE